MGLRDNGRSGNGDASLQWMTRLSSFSIKERNGAVNQESKNIFFFFFKMAEIAVCLYTDGTLGLF